MSGEETGGVTLPYAPLNLSHIAVDLDGLDDFRTLLGRELDTNLRPGVAGIHRDHRLGVGFGVRNAGARVQQARQRYHDSLAVSTANLASYVEASEILIEAIRRTTANYRASDLSSAEMIRLIGQAVTAIQQAQLAATRRDDAREAHRLEAVRLEGSTS